MTETKLTARIDAKTYNHVKQHLHHGQQTLLLRQLFASLKKLIEEDKMNEIIDYLYNNNPLILPKTGD